MCEEGVSVRRLYVCEGVNVCEGECCEGGMSLTHRQRRGEGRGMAPLGAAVFWGACPPGCSVTQQVGGPQP